MMQEPKFVVALIKRHDSVTPIGTPIDLDTLEVLTVSRRGKPEDLGLPGGKIEPNEAIYEALRREVLEETDVAIEASWTIMDREEDTADGGVARCYSVVGWNGTPKTKEEGCHVSWRHWRELLGSQCSFRSYNEKLFRHLGWLKD